MVVETVVLPLSHTWAWVSNSSVATKSLSVPVAVTTCVPKSTPSRSTRVENVPSAAAFTVADRLRRPAGQVICSSGMKPDPWAVTKAPTQGPGSNTAISALGGVEVEVVVDV